MCNFRNKNLVKHVTRFISTDMRLRPMSFVRRRQMEIVRTFIRVFFFFTPTGSTTVTVCRKILIHVPIATIDERLSFRLWYNVSCVSRYTYSNAIVRHQTCVTPGRYVRLLEVFELYIKRDTPSNMTLPCILQEI